MCPWIGCSLTTMPYYTLCTSGYVDDVIFSHNGATRVELKTTLCFVEFVRWRQRWPGLLKYTIALYYNMSYLVVFSLDTCYHKKLHSTKWYVRPTSAISQNNKCSKCFGKRPHRCFVTSCGGECIRPPRALGRHIRQRR